MLNTNITNFRKNIFSLLEQTIKYNEPVNISTKAGNAVIISEEDYNGLMETTKKAAEDIPQLKAAKLDKKAKALIEVIRENPYQTPPPYEKLMGDLQGAYSRRINIKHRLVYEVLEKEQTVKIISLWTHYEF